MSRIGNQPLQVHKDATVEVKANEVHIKGPKGEFQWPVPRGIEVAVEDGTVTVSRKDNAKQTRAMHGTARALIRNMMIGAVEGYTKELELQGVGFRAQSKGAGQVTLNLGYSHPIDYSAPEGVTITVNGETALVITGCDKQKVGQAAAAIRAFYPAEPYKGKGVRYKGEQVRRKVGKAVS